MDARPSPHSLPRIRSVGVSGMLVTFAGALSEPANRAALAFRAAIDCAGWPEVEETSTSLVSTFVRFDPLGVSHNEMGARLTELLAAEDWYHAALPSGRRHFWIPTVYGTDLAPQFGEVAAAAGVSEAKALETLSQSRVRVLTIGFAPGQPYLGELPPAYDLPRQTGLTPQVPEGALVLAIRQFVLFSAPAPTGWRHVGQTAFRCFRPEEEDPFAFRPGDEVTFRAVSPETFAAIRTRDRSGNGGAEIEVIP